MQWVRERHCIVLIWSLNLRSFLDGCCLLSLLKVEKLRFLIYFLSIFLVAFELLRAELSGFEKNLMFLLPVIFLAFGFLFDFMKKKSFFLGKKWFFNEHRYL